METPIFPAPKCDVCGILVGPLYHEKELYRYPVEDMTITVDEPIHYDAATLSICGSCAKKRHLPQSYRISPTL